MACSQFQFSEQQASNTHLVWTLFCQMARPGGREGGGEEGSAAVGAQNCSAQENKVTKKVTKGSELDLGPAHRTLLSSRPLLLPLCPSLSSPPSTPSLAPRRAVRAGLARENLPCPKDSIKDTPKGTKEELALQARCLFCS